MENENKENENTPQESSRWNNFVSMLSLRYIAIGAVIAIIGVFLFGGLIGNIIAGIFVGYFVNRGWKLGALNGWFAGFISTLVIFIIGLVLLLVNGIVSNVPLVAWINYLIIQLAIWIIFGFIGAVGGAIGAKIAEMRKK